MVARGASMRNDQQRISSKNGFSEWTWEEHAKGDRWRRCSRWKTGDGRSAATLGPAGERLPANEEMFSKQGLLELGISSAAGWVTG